MEEGKRKDQCVDELDGVSRTVVQDCVVVCEVISEVDRGRKNYRSFVVSMIIKMLS